LLVLRGLLILLGLLILRDLLILLGLLVLRSLLLIRLVLRGLLLLTGLVLRDLRLVRGAEEIGEETYLQQEQNQQDYDHDQKANYQTRRPTAPVRLSTAFLLIHSSIIAEEEKAEASKVERQLYCNRRSSGF
jgi:hypothetical protein